MNATWKEYRQQIMPLLAPFYETHPDNNVRVLRRKSEPGMQEVDQPPTGPDPDTEKAP